MGPSPNASVVEIILTSRPDMRDTIHLMSLPCKQNASPSDTCPFHMRISCNVGDRTMQLGSSAGEVPQSSLRLSHRCEGVRL